MCFIYVDSEDRPVATTEMPLAEAGQFAALELKDFSRAGAFLDWGLPKDLLLPRSEQKNSPTVGDTVVVKVKFDKVSGRMIATQKLAVHRSQEPPDFQPGEKVEALLATSSELGWTAVVNGVHLGLIFHNEVFRDLAQGEVVDAYVKEIREEDGRIDLSLQAPGYVGKIPPLRNQILRELEMAQGGFLPFHDKSAPETIRDAFSCSKKNFKQAVGALYREGLIQLKADGIVLKRAPGAQSSGRGRSDSAGRGGTRG